MTHVLLTASKQEIFNQAVEGLANQDWVRSYSDSLGGCLYTSTNSKGQTVHCALGILDANIPEDLSPFTSFEDDFFKYLTRDCDNPTEYKPTWLQRVGFLAELQYCHDFGFTPKEMKNNLRILGSDYELEIPSQLLN